MHPNLYNAAPNTAYQQQHQQTLGTPQTQQNQQSQQQQQQQQQPQYPPTGGVAAWPPQQQHQPQYGAPPLTAGLIPNVPQSQNNAMPPIAGQPSTATQATLNGNYQQQLASSMSGLNVNPLKQQPPLVTAQPFPATATSSYNLTNANVPPTTTTTSTITAAGPQQLNGAPSANMPERPPLTNINNNFGVTPYTNGAASPAPVYPPTVASGQNQMSLNSGNLPGLPHMPPPRTTTPGQDAYPTNLAFGAAQQQQNPPMMQPPAPIVQQPGMPPLPGQYAAPVSYAGQAPPLPPPTNTQPVHQTQPNPYGPPSTLAGPAQCYVPNQIQGGFAAPMIPPQPTAQPMQGRPGFQTQPPPPVAGGIYQQQAQYQQQQQQQRRLDPDQMPNPIQVMIENENTAGGVFVTNQAGLLPPLVTTKFVVHDQGNSSPRFLRSSLYCIPSTGDLLKTTALPFTITISPYAQTAQEEYEPPIINFGELGPIRCNRCKAYMSPNMQFVDAGRRFQCLMCKVTSEVPTEYFQHLDHTGQRVDKYERPELMLGTYEFIATKEYCRNNTEPEVPAFIFVIDVSYNTIKSGLVQLLCSQIKKILKHLPVDQGQKYTKMRIGFITYNSSVHFYNIKSNLAQPQMMVVGDVQDMFMPLLDGFLVDPIESETVIDALMAQIPAMFADTKETETILYPAIQAGLEALKASNTTGKLLVFNSSLPIADAPGKLKNRDDRKLLGTDKEKTVLTPQTTSYNQLGQDCVKDGCAVDLFVFNNSYVDIATIGQVARLTGGEVYKYTYFQAEVDGNRLIQDIIKNISRPIAFDAVMRVRTSTGIRPTEFYGHFFMTNTTDVELASVDSTKSICIEIKHDDKLPTEENIFLQVALLYTSCAGQRRLRILNLALRATNTIADVFKSCDLDAIMLFFAKQACFKLMELTPKQVKDNVIHRSAQILACYRKHCTSPTSAGQLILPECLKLLPLYVSCLLKNDAISGGSDMTLDDRSYVIQFVLSMDLNTSVSYLYPRLLPLHNVDPDEDDFPMSLRCTHEKMSDDGAYILENGIHFFVWLGQSLPQSFIQPLFGVQCTQQVNVERFAITADTIFAVRISRIINKIMSERTRHMRITGVRQNDKLESVFRHFLVEDRGTDGTASYVDFLCHMHKEIKDLLS